MNIIPCILIILAIIFWGIGEITEAFEEDKFAQRCLNNHRLAWAWISVESLSQKRCVTLEEAFKHFNWSYTNVFSCPCACNIGVPCNKCIVKWPHGFCYSFNSPYTKWQESRIRGDYIAAAEYARQIAYLPEREIR